MRRYWGRVGQMFGPCTPQATDFKRDQVLGYQVNTTAFCSPIEKGGSTQGWAKGTYFNNPLLGTMACAMHAWWDGCGECTRPFSFCASCCTKRNDEHVSRHDGTKASTSSAASAPISHAAFNLQAVRSYYVDKAKSRKLENLLL